MKNIIIFFTAILLSACGSKVTRDTQSEKTTGEMLVNLTDAQIKNAGIETGGIEQKSISTILKVNGVIDVPPQNMISISVPLGGFLKSTKLLPGMHVIKGEVIATMEDQQYIQLQEEYLTAMANNKFIEGEYNRQKELNQSKASSDKVFQQTEASYKSQKITIKSLYEKLKLIGINPDNLTENSLSRSLNIHSPINGFVSKVNVNIGKYVNPPDVLFELVNPEDIHLSLAVFEKDLDKLFIGQKLLTYTNSNSQKKFPCEIILIGKDISNERIAVVHCHFEKYDKNLIPGMYMNAEIDVKSNNADVLPEAAVVRSDNKHYVFAAGSKNQFEMIEVSAGITENGFTEILSSQNIRNKTFVTKGAYTILMEMKNKKDE